MKPLELPGAREEPGVGHAGGLWLHGRCAPHIGTTEIGANTRLRGTTKTTLRDSIVAFTS